MNTLSVLKVLKAELKRSKISYRMLAKELKLSEAGIKKMFTRNDLSLARASQICQVLNISLPELIARSEGTSQLELRFTDKQIEFLKKHPSFFNFYMKLAYEQKSPAEIQAEHSLSLKSLNSYLKKLEEIRLIKRHPKDRTQIVGGAPLAVNTSGTELDQLKFETIGHLLTHLQRTKSGLLGGASLYLTKTEMEDFKNKWIETLTSYGILSNRNRRSRNTRASAMSTMFVQSPTSMFPKILEIN